VEGNPQERTPPGECQVDDAWQATWAERRDPGLKSHGPPHGAWSDAHGLHEP
jgi:hypothetical protein